jgi:hypothetical protein
MAVILAAWLICWLMALLTSPGLILAVLGVAAAAGTAYLARSMYQDRGMTWRPSAPPVPAAAGRAANPVRPVRPRVHAVARTPEGGYEATR